MRLFAKDATVTTLPDWKGDARVVAATARVEGLARRQQELEATIKTLRRGGRHPGDEALEALPNPAHPMWPFQRDIEAVYAEGKEAKEVLIAAERAARGETEPVGYRAGRTFFEEKLQPAIDHLRDVVQEYEQLQAAVSEKTGAALPALGTVALSPSTLDEWCAVKRRDFGS
jgi:hypothetical protein